MTVNKNNATIVETEIHGDLVFGINASNNAILVNNRVAGEWAIHGSGHLCSGNRVFDGVASDERLVCDEADQ